MSDIIIKPGITGTGITPQMPTEPTPEAKAMSFEFKPELIGADTDSTIKVDKVEVKVEPSQVKQEEQKKQEAKTEEKNIEQKQEEKKSVLKPPTEEKVVAKQEQKKAEEKPVIKPITPVKEKSDQQDVFDYSKYPKHEEVNLKNMSKQSREAYAKLLDENKQLSTLKDSNYLQHEQGYTLSPEYQELNSKSYLARTEAQCWETALLNIKAMKPFRNITGFDQKGNPILGEEMQPTDRDEIRITRNLQACEQVAQQIGGQLQQLPQRFKQQITQDLQAIRDTQKQLFAWHSDPKLMDYKLEIEGIGERTLSQIKQDVRQMIPSYHQNNPLADVLGDMMIALRISQAEAREAKHGQEIAQIKQSEIARAEPTSDNADTQTTNTGPKGVPRTFSIADFNPLAR